LEGATGGGGGMKALDTAELGIVQLKLFGKGECERLRAMLAADDSWQRAEVRDERTRDGAVWRPQDRLASTNEFDTLPELAVEIATRIEQTVLPQLREHFNSDVHTLVDLNVVRYGLDGMYRIHIDNGPGLEHRRFTVVCYLNDGMVGGETDFPDLNVRVTPKAGMAVVFPSEYRHASLPVMQGEKCAIVCWVMGTPSGSWI
jgi:predicted 2-oxoglutarate/Fe(II)-dependent dioxygenase YbiX